MSVTLNGLDEFQKELQNMQKSAQELEGTQNIPLSELLSDSFMREHTNFSSLYEMFKQFGYSELSQQEFDEIPEKEMDSKVSKSTCFESWSAMMEKAVEIYISNRLGF